ncbi:unnamed protein product [Prunus armeniaca]
MTAKWDRRFLELAPSTAALHQRVFWVFSFWFMGIHGEGKEEEATKMGLQIFPSNSSSSSCLANGWGKLGPINSSVTLNIYCTHDDVQCKTPHIIIPSLRLLVPRDINYPYDNLLSALILPPSLSTFLGALAGSSLIFLFSFSNLLGF